MAWLSERIAVEAQVAIAVTLVVIFVLVAEPVLAAVFRFNRSGRTPRRKASRHDGRLVLPADLSRQVQSLPGRSRTPKTHPCHRCGSLQTAHVKYGLWSCQACMTPETALALGNLGAEYIQQATRAVQGTFQPEDEELTPEEESQLASADAQLVLPAEGVQVQTLLGTLLFQTTHDVGRLGDQLTHIYYQSSDTKEEYRRHKSKRTSVHGIDAVYSCRTAEGLTNVLVIENKVNKSRLKKDQLSDDGIRERAQWLVREGDHEQQKTGRLVMRALRASDQHCLYRVLHAHDLVLGISMRLFADQYGDVLRKTGKERVITHRLTRLLEQRLASGVCKRLSSVT